MKKFYEQFKTPLITIILIFIAFFLYTKLAGPIPFFINSVQTTKTDLFTADGQGQETAVPDQATVSIGITQNAATVLDAKDKTNEAVNKVIDGLKSLGLSDKDIKTTNYSVTPNYGEGVITTMMFPAGKTNNNITGYTVTQNLDIKIKQTSLVNKVIESVTKDGANLVGGVNFTFSDELEQTLEQKARIIAVNKAKQKAQNLANAAGIKLGRVINVVENSSFPRAIPMMALAKADAATNSQTNVTPGENTVTINVTIYYETY